MQDNGNKQQPITLHGHDVHLQDPQILLVIHNQVFQHVTTL